MKEKELVLQCRKSKVSAQNRLFDTYSPMLRGICRRYMGDSDLAEDVLQIGFYKIFTQIDKFEWQGEGSLFFWAKRIMINCALNELKIYV